MTRSNFLFLIFFCLAGPTRADVRLPRLISNGMVLQRDTRVRIWGWASPGEKVRIRFAGADYPTEAGADGTWMIHMQPQSAGGPYEMRVEGKNTLVVNDIMVGEVWICSGQSNMVLPMRRVQYKYPDIIAQSENPRIRQFLVSIRYSFHDRLDDLESGSWQNANPHSVMDFSATAYFFARELYATYHIPVGLINVSAGGAPIEAWMSEQALQEFPAALATLAPFRNPAHIDSIQQHDNLVSSAWFLDVWKRDSGTHAQPSWYDPSYPTSSWRGCQVPGYWTDEGFPGVHGVMWFRREVEIPAGGEGKDAKLWLGAIVDRDSVFWNGVFVGSIAYRYPPRIYDIPANLLRPGKNTLVVRVINYAANGGFVPGKTYALIAGKDSIKLEGTWSCRLGTVAPVLAPSTFIYYQPLGLFNGMIAPLLNYTIKGVIWYQGESNTGDAAAYAKLFPAMITDWRREWRQGDFPFLFVQLPNYGDEGSSPENKWAAFREVQRKSLMVPNTGMAVTVDIGEANDLHPLNKQGVGKRLALLASHIAYGDHTRTYSGPLYQSMEKSGGKILLHFNSTGGGLVVHGGDSLHWFSIAGSDGKFLPARAVIQGDGVLVWNDEIRQPAIVKYAWADNPQGANLFNAEGLPASPFCTTP